MGFSLFFNDTLKKAYVMKFLLSLSLILKDKHYFIRKFHSN